VPIAIYLAGLAIKLGFNINITLDIVNAVPRLHASQGTASTGQAVSRLLSEVYQFRRGVALRRSDEMVIKPGL